MVTASSTDELRNLLTGPSSTVDPLQPFAVLPRPAQVRLVVPAGELGTFRDQVGSDAIEGTIPVAALTLRLPASPRMLSLLSLVEAALVQRGVALLETASSGATALLLVARDDGVDAYVTISALADLDQTDE